jgi:hypothetical protein
MKDTSFLDFLFPNQSSEYIILQLEEWIEEVELNKKPWWKRSFLSRMTELFGPGLCYLTENGKIIEFYNHLIDCEKKRKCY